MVLFVEILWELPVLFLIPVFLLWEENAMSTKAKKTREENAMSAKARKTREENAMSAKARKTREENAMNAKVEEINAIVK
jgi:cytochrome c-type biogenesis protein CcmH/NrfF